MSFDWNGYLCLAEELLHQNTSETNNEAKLRSSISRAYFAAHCIIRNHMKYAERDWSIPLNGRAHSYVINQLRQSTRNIQRSGEEISASMDLKRLKIFREMVDYDDLVEDLPYIAELAFALAQNVVSLYITSN